MAHRPKSNRVGGQRQFATPATSSLLTASRLCHSGSISHVFHASKSFGRVSGFRVFVSLDDDPCGQDVLARAAVPLVFAVPGARALVPFRLQADTMFDVRALDIGFRADRVPFASLLDDADPFLQDQLAGVEQARVERLHLLHVKGKLAVEVGPAGQVEADQAATAEGQLRFRELISASDRLAHGDMCRPSVAVDPGPRQDYDPCGRGQWSAFAPQNRRSRRTLCACKT